MASSISSNTQNVFYELGFLRKEEELASTIKADIKATQEHSCTPQQIADKLNAIYHKAVAIIAKTQYPEEYVASIEKNFEVQITKVNKIDCPFGGWECAHGNHKITVKNKRNNDEIFNFFSLMPHLIEKHNFFGGVGTNFRISPEKVVSYFTLKPNVDYKLKTETRISYELLKTFDESQISNFDKLITKSQIALECFVGDECQLENDSQFKTKAYLVEDKKSPLLEMYKAEKLFIVINRDGRPLKKHFNTYGFELDLECLDFKKGVAVFAGNKIECPVLDIYDTAKYGLPGTPLVEEEKQSLTSREKKVRQWHETQRKFQKTLDSAHAPAATSTEKQQTSSADSVISREEPAPSAVQVILREQSAPPSNPVIQKEQQSSTESTPLLQPPKAVAKNTEESDSCCVIL